MRTTASESASGRLWMGMVVAVLVALVTIPAIQSSVSAHDHQIPQTYLKKGTMELQAGTRVAESNWVRPAGDGLCANENTSYRWRFPDTSRVAAGSKLKVRIFKTQRPDFFEITAYPALDEEGTPSGESRLLPRSLERVVRDGKTVAWDAYFEVNRADRHYYLVGEGHWKDREGCGGVDQYASWSFHVKTRSLS